jgi:hypothetical protein
MGTILGLYKELLQVQGHATFCNIVDFYGAGLLVLVLATIWNMIPCQLSRKCTFQYEVTHVFDLFIVLVSFGV